MFLHVASGLHRREMAIGGLLATINGPSCRCSTMKTKRTSEPYVYRAVDKENHVDGYLAKVVRRDARLHKIFQIAKHGGNRERCFRAATKAARAFAREHPRLTRRAMAELPRKKKDRDLPMGVRRVRHLVNGRKYDFFEASWSPRPHHQKKKRFSVNRYGEAKAKRMALQTRKAGLAALVD